MNSQSVGEVLSAQNKCKSNKT